MFRFFRKLFGDSTPARSGTRRHMIDVCPDCGVAEGQLHELLCLKERCPFCGGQLATCECLGHVLQLTPEEQQLVDEYVDDSIPPLSTIMKRWRAALEQKGRVPFQAQPDTPYHAAYRGDLPAIRDFLDDGLVVGVTNEVGYTVLMSAARGGNIEILRLLLSRGANASQADNRGYTVLHWMVAQSAIDPAAQAVGVNLLIDEGADPNASNQDGITPLMNAAWFGCSDAVRELLRRGADGSRKDNKGRTAQSMALERGHHEVAEMLGPR
jgi:hypothetical protein